MVRAVIFDIDGVLLASFEANLKFFQDLMAKFGYPPPTREEYPALFPLPMYEHIKMLTKLTSEEEIKKIWEVGKSGAVSFHEDLAKVPLGVEDALKILSQQYPLGIVTSRVREAVFRAPQMKKLKSYFQVAIAYQDTVKHKPDPEPLFLAAEKLQVKPAEVVYIGDADVDIVAGRAAGMRVVVYAKENRLKADGCFSVFSELPELIKTF